MAGIFFKQYRYYIVILAGVVAGTLLANLAIDNVTDKIGIFNPDFKNAFANVNLDGTLYLRYICYEVKRIHRLVACASYTGCNNGNICFYGCCGDKYRNDGKRECYEYGSQRNVHICRKPSATVYYICRCRFFHSILYRKKTSVAIIISLLFLITGTLYETYISPVLIGKLLEHISYCI